MADAGDGGAEVSLIVQSEQVDAGCGGGWHVSKEGIGSDRSEKVLRVERGEGVQDRL